MWILNPRWQKAEEMSTYLHLRLCEETGLWRQAADRVNFLAPYRWRQHFLSYSFLHTSRFRLNPTACAVEKKEKIMIREQGADPSPPGRREGR
jgi:hypothetical protein